MKSLVNDSVITCDEIIETPETVSTDCINKIESYTFHTMLLVTICLLFSIIITINCYYIKLHFKQKTY